MARKSGRLTQWDDERGFGFIAGDDGLRSFVHISGIKRSAIRPQLGDSVTYVPGTGKDGRPAATAVVILGAQPPPTPTRAPATAARRSSALGVGLRILAAALIVLCALAATQLARAPIWVLLAYLMLGVVSILAYWFDKNAAEAGRWRVRESTLHTIDLIGGIAGGLVAQALLRHKTRKQSFAALTGLIVLGHGTLLGTLTFGVWDFPAALGS